ncbi:MAG TPA: hypothetical protein VG347_21325 [Verrucomicrobiae bacterium]|nr:hypothetical protein [Verrucomicrobiae bacterium]
MLTPALTIDTGHLAVDENVHKVVDAIGAIFTIVPRSQISKKALAETQVAGLDFAEKTIARFASEAVKLSQSSTKNFDDFVEGVRKRTLELEKQFQQQTQELQEKHQKREADLDSSFQGKLKDLEGREKLHNEAVKQFELRNNTVVRRDLLKEIRNKIEQQASIKISPSTVSKRWIIHVVCALTMIISIALVGFFVSQIYKATTIDWKTLVPLSTWTALFIMTGVYYLRWNDQWFRDHARAEFENRKFSADILRASWVAELFFEWAEKKGVSIPPELVDSFTKNLFDNVSSDGRLHPADQLSDLVKQFSTIEVSKGGVKVSRKVEKENGN